ncbi:EAL domain-containing protein [Thalassotalea sp. LPB0316]|uniref:EAL domain-containing protein n=1 Tax=Thalassotalea sp. LPB0316 TaxID=2769490 RepID=UPI001D04B5AB|nr:GGDEF domain-containing protein [Thalassotalea sp. LPB0316]
MGLIFSVGLIALCTWFGQTLLQERHEKFEGSLIAMAGALDQQASIQTIVKTIKGANDYRLLLITNDENKNLMKHQGSQQHLISKFIAPANQEVWLNSHSLKVTYALADDIFIDKLINIYLAIVLSTAAFVIISSIVSLKSYRAFFNTINEQIRNEITSFMPSADDEIHYKTKATVELPELRKGLTSLQSLIENQKANSNQLEKEAYTETLTQLPNRNRFVQYFESKVTELHEIKFGVLLITRCSELQTINQISGYKEGDNYICKVSDILKSEIEKYQGGQLFRLNSSDFSTILPNVTMKEAEKYAQALTDKFNQYQQSADLDSVAYSGVVAFTDAEPLGEILALADTAISVAQTQSINGWYAQKEGDTNSPSNHYGNQNWRQEIDSVLAAQRVALLIQPIKPSTKNTKMYGEILARFKNAKNETLPTASFIAMAEKLDKIVAVDRMIIEQALTEISQKNLQGSQFGINISSRSIHDEHFLIWLERRLLRESSIAPNLIFEITEYGLQQNVQTSKRFIDMIHRVGSRVTVERFGVGLTSFKFFKELKPDYIKMDSTYTRDIDEDKNNQYFLRVMVDLAHRLSINVLAENVETQEEKHTLEKLFVDGCQGFYIGKPEQM